MTQRSLYDELMRVRMARSNGHPVNKNGNQSYRGKRNRTSTSLSFMRPYRDVMSLIADGKDHINVWTSAETDLGAVLDHAGPLSLNHSVFGFFDNMTAFWFYIQSEERDDRIRGMFPSAAYSFGKQMTSRRIVNFRAIIADTNWQRIKSKPMLVKMLALSELPFDAYRIDNRTGLRMRPPFFGWLLWSFEEIRNAIKENREPDFTPLLDRPGSDIYEFVRPKTIEHPVESMEDQPPSSFGEKENHVELTDEEEQVQLEKELRSISKEDVLSQRAY